MFTEWEKKTDYSWCVFTYSLLHFNSNCALLCLDCAFYRLKTGEQFKCVRIQFITGYNNWWFPVKEKIFKIQYDFPHCEKREEIPQATLDKWLCMTVTMVKKSIYFKFSQNEIKNNCRIDVNLPSQMFSPNSFELVFTATYQYIHHFTLYLEL